MHPAIIAQAAATAASMMPGHFFLGVGSGEALNEHVVGLRWPSASVRQDMLVEAIEIMRLLWQGGFQSYDGEYFLVEEARIYMLPETPPEVMVGAAGPRAATVVGQLGDGLIVTAPKPELVQRFEQAGGAGKPRFGQVNACWAEDEAQARRTALEYWPNAALPGQLGQELPLPRRFEQATQLVTEEQVAEAIVCGRDRKHAQAIQEYVDAGCDHVYVHQVGPDQEGFLDFYRREILPRFGA
jgi:G6PDH family F420-dependent oxidoreductase